MPVRPPRILIFPHHAPWDREAHMAPLFNKLPPSALFPIHLGPEVALRLVKVSNEPWCNEVYLCALVT